MQGRADPGRLWDQATDSQSKSATAGADNASGTHRPGQPFDLFADQRWAGSSRRCRSGWTRIANSSGWRQRDYADTALRRRGEKACRPSWFCAALLKQHRQLSYEELAFHLEDWACFEPSRGCRCRGAEEVGAAQTISAIRAETWEAINRSLLASARQEKIELARSYGSTARSPLRSCTSQATAVFSGMLSA